MQLRIKELRKELNLSQQEVATGAGISRSVLSEYESGNVDPSATALSKLADFFRTSTDYLMGREDDFGQLTTRAPGDFYTSPTEQKLILNFRRIPPDSQNYVLGIVQNLAANS